MGDNVTLPGTGVAVEALDVGSGVERQAMHVADMDGALRNALVSISMLLNGMNSSGQTRVLLDAITTSLTLSTVTTVSTVTNLSQFGGRDATQTIPDLSITAWATAVLPCIART